MSPPQAAPPAAGRTNRWAAREPLRGYGRVPKRVNTMTPKPKEPTSTPIMKFMQGMKLSRKYTTVNNKVPTTVSSTTVGFLTRQRKELTPDYPTGDDPG